MPRSISSASSQLCATTSSLPTTFHDWPRLPDELKVEILSHALTFYQRVSSIHHTAVHRLTGEYSHEESLREHLYALIGTRNRHVVALAQEVYYKNNTFLISLDTRYVAAKLSYPKAPIARMIRHLEVDFNLGSCSIGDTLLEPGSGWRWLVRATRPSDSDSCRSQRIRRHYRETTQPGDSYTAWQQLFTNLTSLKLTVTVFDVYYSPWTELEDKQCCIRRYRLSELVAWLKDTELLFKAVIVRAVLLVDFSYMHYTCEHSEILLHLKAMATKQR